MTIVKKNRSFYNAFLGVLIKEGKKTKAKTILDFSLKTASLKTGKKVSSILLKIIKNTGTLLEVRRRRVGRQIYTVPFPVNKWRRKFLAVKGLISVVSKDKTKITFEEKLTSEIINLVLDRETKTLTENRNKLKTLVSNRSNLHYRW